MIWYFSGTGNSRWVAEEIARQTGDTACSMIGADGPGSVQGQVLGIVFPIYAWSVPGFVLDFLSTLSGESSYAYAIGTCGETAGMAMDGIKSRFSLDSIWSVALPSNYIMGFELEPDDMIRRKFKEAEAQIGEMAKHVSAGQALTHVTRGAFPRLKTSLFGTAFQIGGRSTRPFRVSDRCISCSLCEDQCPSGAIRMVEGKPEWIMKTCFQCTACINRCPVNAIDYGKKTGNRQRYRIEGYTATLGPGDEEQGGLP